jgi:hypothetical protein
MKKACLIAISTGLLATCVVASAAARKNKGYILELFDGDALFHDVDVAPKMRGVIFFSYSIFRVPASQTAQTPDGQRVYAFQIVHELRGDAVKLEVLALLEDPDTVSEEHPMHGLKKQAAGVYEVGNGESVVLSGMTNFGVRPLTAKVKQEGAWF